MSPKLNFKSMRKGSGRYTLARHGFRHLFTSIIWAFVFVEYNSNKFDVLVFPRINILENKPRLKRIDRYYVRLIHRDVIWGA